MRKPKSRRPVRKTAPPRTRGRAKASKRGAAESLDRRVRRIVREVVREEPEPPEDRLDYLGSEASLADGAPVPAEEVWEKLGA